MIKDLKGDEHPIEPGMLVLYAGNSDDKHVFRVGNERIDGSEIWVLNPINEFGYWLRYSRLTLLTTDPPNEKENAISLNYRRINLVRNLARAYEASYDKQGWTVIRKLRNMLNSTPNNEVTWFWNSVAESFDDPRQISYAAKPEHYDNDVRRKRCSFAKFLKGPAQKIGGLNFTDEECDAAAKLVGDTFPDSYNYEFEVVTGPAIKRTYYEEGEANSGSCMYRKKYVGWYAQNKESVAMLRINQGGTLVGRALLWNTEQGVKVLDRIYPSNNGPHTQAAHIYAKSQGWDYKTRQSSCCDGLASERMDYTIRMLPSKKTVGYPYLDTFKFSDNDPEVDEVIVLKQERGDFCFNDTGGHYSGQRRYCSCGERANRQRRVNGRYWCDECHNDQFVYLNYDLGTGGHYAEGTYRRERVTLCDQCEGYRLPEHFVDVHTREGEVTRCCSGCANEIATRCDACDHWNVPERIVETTTGANYCRDCAEAILVQCEQCSRYMGRGNALVCTDGVEEGLSSCQDCARIALARGQELEYQPLMQQPEPVAAPPIVEMPTPELQAELSYPNEGFDYDHCCGCVQCQAIKERREREMQGIRDEIEDCGGAADCAGCNIAREQIQAHIEGPYPNTDELAVLRQRERATNPMWTTITSTNGTSLGQIFYRPDASIVNFTLTANTEV